MRSPWLRALAALSVLAPSLAAAQNAPLPDAGEPPAVLIVVPPLTSFPDPIALSLAANLRGGFTVEGGVSALAPGAFARAGLTIPVTRDPGGGTDLLAYGGYRVIALPLMEPVQGPTAGIGFRRWKRSGWGLQLNAGLWMTDAKVDCAAGDCPLGPDNRVILPEVRLAAIRAR